MGKIISKIKFFFTISVMICLLINPLYSDENTKDNISFLPRIKDICNVDDVRDNILIGYGLVVGLNGTGDGKNMPFTQISLSAMLERFGIKTNNSGTTPTIDSKNVAAVIVTAVLKPFARHGSKIDVTISSLGSATSLLGGTLLVTPLYGADGEVYAVAQGPVASSGFNAQASAGGGAARASVTKGVPTTGRIVGGAIIEKEIDYDFTQQKVIRLSLRNPDFTTARRVVEIINREMKEQIATALDSGTITLNLPNRFHNNPVEFMTYIEQLQVPIDHKAKIVIDDKDGIIAFNGQVRINPVAIAHGALTIKVSENSSTSTMNYDTNVTGGVGASNTSMRQTLSNAKASVEISEGEKQIGIVRAGASLDELAKGLRDLGATPRDLITVLQALKACGAIQAEIEVI